MIAIQRLLSDAEARDVLEIALNDGASLYWIARVIKSDVRSSVTGRVIFEASRPDAPRERFSVTPADINYAALALICNRLASDDILADVARRDFDQTSADCLIQIATFGEIIYG